MAATPPFTLDVTSPAASSIISTFPPNEQANRQQISDWLAYISDPVTGLIKTQALSVALAALNALTPAANRIPYFTSGTVASLLDLTTLLNTTSIASITTAATGAWAGRLLNLRSGAPGISLQDSTGGAVSTLISLDANVMTVYSTILNDGTDLVARFTINLTNGAAVINGNVTVNGTMTVTG